MRECSNKLSVEFCARPVDHPTPRETRGEGWIVERLNPTYTKVCIYPGHGPENCLSAQGLGLGPCGYRGIVTEIQVWNLSPVRMEKRPNPKQDLRIARTSAILGFRVWEPPTTTSCPIQSDNEQHPEQFFQRKASQSRYLLKI